jgi:hypothetical protein
MRKLFGLGFDWRAIDRLKNKLPANNIRGEGFHEGTGLRSRVTASEWATYRIHFTTSSLRPGWAVQERAFPLITGVVVNRDDLLAAVEAKGKAASARKPFPPERFPELREFLKNRLYKNDDDAWKAAEEHFDAKMTREVIRDAIETIGAKGPVGRPEKFRHPQAERRNFSRNQIVSTT